MLHSNRHDALRTFQQDVPTTAPGGRDADVHKGATEDGHPCVTTNAPGLDADGLPNDETAIAEDAIGAREDGSQG